MPNKNNITQNKASEEIIDNEICNLAHFSDFDFIFESADKLDFINSLNVYCDKHFASIESGVYFAQFNGEFSIKQDFYYETLLNQVYKNLLEGGIIDWIMNDKTHKILPNSYCDLFDNSTYVALFPIHLQSKKFAIFIAILKTPSLDEIQLNKLGFLARQSALALDSFFSQEKRANHVKTINALKNNIFSLAANASIGELAANAFNEIKAPLENLLANLKLAESGVGAFSSRIKIIEANANKIKIFFSKLEDLITNSSKSERENIFVSAIIEETLFFCERQLNCSGIDVYIDGNENDISIKVNKNELILALLSLMFFSRELMPDGGKISVAYNAIANNFVSISIIDSGIGLEPASVAKIFEPDFALTDSASGKLNLSLAKMIIESYRGAISIFSETGKGSTFKINLPISS